MTVTDKNKLRLLNNVLGYTIRDLQIELDEEIAKPGSDHPDNAEFIEGMKQDIIELKEMLGQVHDNLGMKDVGNKINRLAKPYLDKPLVDENGNKILANVMELINKAKQFPVAE